MAEDIKLVGITEQSAMQMSKHLFKRTIKSAITRETLKYLKEIQQTHPKVNEIQYTTLQAQSYFKSPLFSNSEAKCLFKYRIQKV